MTDSTAKDQLPSRLMSWSQSLAPTLHSAPKRQAMDRVPLGSILAQGGWREAGDLILSVFICEMAIAVLCSDNRWEGTW